jgi:putative nucleotidyltransferase with HDIG domain
MQIAPGNGEDGSAIGGMTLFHESGLPRFVDRRVTVFGTEAPVHRPPRLLVRTLLVTFATVFAILVAVFVLLVLDLRSRVQTEVADNLETSRRVLADLEARRLLEVGARAAALTGNPTFEAAMQKYANEFGGFTAIETRQSMVWLDGELQAMAEALGADVVAAIDRRHVTMAKGGRLSAGWPMRSDLTAPASATATRDALLTLDTGFYRTTSLRLRANGADVGTLCVARRVDAHRAAAISTITRAETVFLVHGRLVASTLSSSAGNALAAAWRGQVPEHGEIKAGRERYAFRRLDSVDGAEAYALASVSAPASSTTAKAFRALALVGLGAVALAILGSFFLAHTLAGPIDGISRSLSAAVGAKDFGVRLTPDGSSREVEVLAETFNELMGSLARAEDETRSAYLGAIEALAKALEARDQYTAGHSERVGALSVRIAQRMGLSAAEVEEVRLGAALHDIGKIGVSDGVLGKRGPLTTDERMTIEAHALLGARILEPVGFLAAQLPIVELHHERPDGRGYPHGLTGARIPLPASIVHLADAFDAMTSDRPYRPGCSVGDAVLEILRCRGSQFDETVVEAFLGVIGESGDAAGQTIARCHTPAGDSAGSETSCPGRASA